MSSENREKVLQRREIHQGLAKKLTTMRKSVSFTAKDGTRIEGSIRSLGGGEIIRAFQAEGVELSELTTAAKMTWAKMLVQNQVISRAFIANDGRTFSPQELEELVSYESLASGEISAIAREIFNLSGLSPRETEMTSGSETGQPLETFRPK